MHWQCYNLIPHTAIFHFLSIHVYVLHTHTGCYSNSQLVLHIGNFLELGSRHEQRKYCGCQGEGHWRFSKSHSDAFSNKDLRRVTGQEDINLEIRKRILRWIGHTLRKEDGEIPKAALLWNPQGSRKRGRPKNSWRRSVIQEVGRSWNELRFLAADRQKWKELIDNLCS